MARGPHANYSLCSRHDTLPHTLGKYKFKKWSDSADWASLS